MDSTGSTLFAVIHDPADGNARNRFVERYRPHIVAIACRYFPDKHQAEDVAQDVLLKLLLRLADFKYDPDGSFRAYVRRATYHAAVDAFRARRRQVGPAIGGSSNARQVSLAPNPTGTPDAVEQESTVPDDFVEDATSLLASALWQQAEKDVRRQFDRGYWRCYEVWKARKLGRRGAWGGALAAKLGISENAVHKRASRVRAVIRKQFESSTG